MPLMSQDDHVSDKRPELDPEFFDIILQALSVLSSVATVASTWIMLRDQRTGIPPAVGQVDFVRQQLRQMRRNIEDTFDSAESVIRILEAARARSVPGTSLLNEQPRFGAGLRLTVEEMGQANNLLNQLESAAMQVRNAARNITVTVGSQHISDASARFDSDEFNQQLNSILFESRTLGEAMTKLRLAQQQAEDFVRDLERSLRTN